MIGAKARIGGIPEVAKNKAVPRRVLAVDYGRKRIGLALSDELGLTARPLATIVRTNRRSDLRRLRELCRANQVTQIVVGNPLHISGKSSPMAEEAARFAARLRKELGVPVELQDERLTSWEAEQMVSEIGASPQRRRGPVDNVAAAILLREYLAKATARTPARRITGE